MALKNRPVNAFQLSRTGYSGEGVWRAFETLSIVVFVVMYRFHWNFSKNMIDIVKKKSTLSTK
jgi:hypothetical protein